MNYFVMERLYGRVSGAYNGHFEYYFPEGSSLFRHVNKVALVTWYHSLVYWFCHRKYIYK